MEEGKAKRKEITPSDVMIVTDEKLNTLTVIVNGRTRLQLSNIIKLSVHHLSPERAAPQ